MEEKSRGDCLLTNIFMALNSLYGAAIADMPLKNYIR